MPTPNRERRPNRSPRHAQDDPGPGNHLGEIPTPWLPSPRASATSSSTSKPTVPTLARTLCSRSARSPRGKGAEAPLLGHRYNSCGRPERASPDASAPRGAPRTREGGSTPPWPQLRDLSGATPLTPTPTPISACATASSHRCGPAGRGGGGDAEPSLVSTTVTVADCPRGCD